MVLKKQKPIKKRLEKELRERCYQIGIPCLQEPRVCWTQEQFRWYTGANKTNSVQRLGCAHLRSNTMLIDLKVHQFHKYTFTEYRDTLIHELVHFRFQNLKHGKTFNKTIERIKKGQKFCIRSIVDLRFP
ncbi:MAG TPA: SprT-like domain-containing protein [Nitrososphaeraceae archaeon]|nr:SprT-like domain-containing protein [Nitrososphaeraceae archaeon]